MDDLEDEFQSSQIESGYREGFEKGRVDAQMDGYAQGSIAGAKIGSELGFIRGQVYTYAQIMETRPEDIKDSYTIPELKRITDLTPKILDLIDNFPKTNGHDCDVILKRIRDLEAQRHKHQTVLFSHYRHSEEQNQGDKS